MDDHAQFRASRIAVPVRGARAPARRWTLNDHEWPNDSLLGRLRGRARETVLGLGTPVSYTARQQVTRQGEDSRYVLLVLSGCVKIVVHSEFGRDVLIELRGGGDLAGELATLEGGVRMATVVTCTATRARLIRGVEFTDLLERNIDVCMAHTRVISQHLRSAHQRAVDFVACSAAQRVVRVLADTARRYGTPLPDGHARDIPLNQEEIASLAGVALSTVEKVLHTMQADGLVARRYRRIVVVDLAGLSQFGELTP
jgi:CRP/FNR family transcriptional regulator, cyclic AMP receptor protein